jgi:hypothetical protein
VTRENYFSAVMGLIRECIREMFRQEEHPEEGEIGYELTNASEWLCLPESA